MYNQINKSLNSEQKTIAVIANGQFPQKTKIIEQIKQSDMIIACDGAIKNLANNHIIADYGIGDGDSTNDNQYNEWLKNPYIKIADQNCNDLSKAINFIQQQFGNEVNILIFAANGLREDHALANIALFMQYTDIFSQLAMISDYGIFTVCHKGTTIVETMVGQQISFFSFDPNTNITCRELKWQLVNQRLPYLNSGTLNQAIADKLTICVDNSILLYRAFETKN